MIVGVAELFFSDPSVDSEPGDAVASSGSVFVSEELPLSIVPGVSFTVCGASGRREPCDSVGWLVKTNSPNLSMVNTRYSCSPAESTFLTGQTGTL